MIEAEERYRRYLQHLKDEEDNELQANSDLIEAFIHFCKAKGIELTKDNFRFHHKIGILAIYPNIVQYIAPSAAKDKEGLVDFAQLSKNFKKEFFVRGYLYSDNYMLMAHPYFRRGFHENANYAPDFVGLFWGINNPLIEPYIALDFDRVRINVDTTSYMEADTWYGAKFSKEIGTIEDGIVKLRPPLDIDEIYLTLFNDAYSLDIKWETKSGIKSFQAEEFKTEESKIIKNGITYYPVRYVHAEFDLDKNHFRHFDGAIHFYTEEEYYIRRDEDFNYNSKNSHQIKTLSEKLFKMNGVVSVDTWVEYTSHFLTGNPLIFEYFEGKYPDGISDIIDKVRAKNNA